jgi:hypothetical protein
MIGAVLVLQLALGTLPNPVTTPGATNPAIDWKNAYNTICAPSGWSTKVIRPSTAYTNRIKRRQMEALGYTVANPLPNVATKRGGTRPDVRYCVPRSANPACYELDHLVNLSLGGAGADERNLWVQPIAEALKKDLLEQTLRRQVCAGRVDLVEAQTAIAANWIRAYREYVEGR